MSKAVTPSRMRRADLLSASRYGIPVLMLMENAGRAVAEAAEELLKRNRGRSVVALCGGGNNGGDAIAAARTLHNRGYNAEAWLLNDPAEWKGSLALHYKIARRMRLRFKRLDRIPARQRLADLRRAALLIDGLLGTGAAGPPRDRYADAIRMINESRRPVISVDIPSGLNADSGTPADPCVHATLTVTMAAVKPGLLKPAARSFVGRLRVCEIGIPSQLLR